MLLLFLQIKIAGSLLCHLFKQALGFFDDSEAIRINKLVRQTSKSKVTAPSSLMPAVHTYTCQQHKLQLKRLGKLRLVISRNPTSTSRTLPNQNFGLRLFTTSWSTSSTSSSQNPSIRFFSSHTNINHKFSKMATAAQPPASVASQTLGTYAFPTHRLRRVMHDSSKTPLVLVACGSFSPITYLHLRMFEMAADFAKFNTEFEVMGGYLSPVSDAYKKAGLASSQHRRVIWKLL